MSAHGIGQHDFMRNKDVVGDHHAGIGSDNSSYKRAVVSNFDLPPRSQIEKCAVVEAGVMPDAHPTGTTTAIMKEGECAVEPAAFPEHNV